MGEQQCLFCRIIAKGAPAHVLDENEEVIVFLSLNNHPLVVTKAHIPDIYTLPSQLGASVMEKAIAVAKAMKVSLQCDGVYVTQANERAAGQDVLHYHLHVYPCWGDRVRRGVVDFARNVTASQELTEDIRAVTAAKLRRELQQAR